MKKHAKNFIRDLVSETPVLFNWLAGIASSLSASCVGAFFVYSQLPADIQSMIPKNVLVVCAVVAFIGSLFAKKQNVK